MKQCLDINCWEFNNCPSDRRDSCPAFMMNSGKRCWVVGGTKCSGVDQGDILSKIPTCLKCRFYRVRRGKIE